MQGYNVKFLYNVKFIFARYICVYKLLKMLLVIGIGNGQEKQEVISHQYWWGKTSYRASPVFTLSL